MNVRRIVCPFLCLLLLCGCRSEELDENKNPNQEIGTTVQDIQYKDTYLESIMYPKPISQSWIRKSRIRWIPIKSIFYRP